MSFFYTFVKFSCSISCEVFDTLTQYDKHITDIQSYVNIYTVNGKKNFTYFKFNKLKQYTDLENESGIAALSCLFRMSERWKQTLNNYQKLPLGYCHLEPCCCDFLLNTIVSELYILFERQVPL